MTKKLILVLLVAFGLAACPNPETGKVDPYLTARTIILQAQTALSVADGIFGQWKLSQTDAEKAKKAEATYQKARAGVAGGLQLALNGVAIAEQAKKDPDVGKLLAGANDAWQTLRKTLGEILGSGDKADIVVAAAPKPAPQPSAEGIGTKTAALTASSQPAKVNPLDQLPKSLLP